MKRMSVVAFLAVLLASLGANAYAQFNVFSIPQKSGIITASDCSGYTSLGQLCQDTDDGKLYKGTGSGVAEVTSASAYTDITALWASGSCSGVLNDDGTCKAIGTDMPGIYDTPTNGHLTKWKDDGGVWKLESAGAPVVIDAGTSTGDILKKTDTGVGKATAGTDYLSPEALEVFIDCNGSADPYSYCTGANASTLTAAYVKRSIINSYGRGEAQTVTLPAAASGMTFIAMVGTQHNSAWKIQRAGSDTITWSSGGTDTTGKTYFQETNQAVGSRVSCITYKTGASAWTWLCGSVTGTWVTD